MGSIIRSRNYSNSPIEEVQLIDSGWVSPNIGKGREGYQARRTRRVVKLQQRKLQKKQLQEQRRGTY